MDQELQIIPSDPDEESFETGRVCGSPPATTEQSDHCVPAALGSAHAGLAGTYSRAPLERSPRLPAVPRPAILHQRETTTADATGIATGAGGSALISCLHDALLFSQAVFTSTNGADI